MYQEKPEWIAEQERRWLRPDGDRYLRHDAERYMKPAPFNHEAFIAEFRAKKAAEAAASRETLPTLLPAQQAREEWMRKQEMLRLKSQIAVLRFQRALILRIRTLEREAKYNENQPRVPAGNPDGGQWTKEGDDADRRLVLSDASPNGLAPGAQYAELRRPGIGHNSNQPDIPQKKPPTPEARNLILKLLAASAIPIAVLEAGPKWLSEHIAEIRASRDPPKSFEELQQAVKKGTSTPGYQDHHIVGQVARKEPNRGFPESKIDDPENIVRIPTLKHRQISAWYQKPNDGAPFYGQTPREYLRGKPWSERYNIGLDILQKHGVLKP